MSITYFEPTVKLIAVTQPLIKRDGSTLTPEESRNGVSAGDAVLTAEQFVVYVARVSNPSNKTNTDTAPKLIKYLLDHGHFSPFELVNLVFEIETTRDISRQILRHEFRPQEFSQRYAEVDPEPAYREPRKQDHKNRQNSIPLDLTDVGHAECDWRLGASWDQAMKDVWEFTARTYKGFLSRGIAKEQARALLPEGLTRTTLMGNWNLRNLIFYIKSREGEDTQKEHRIVAQKIKAIVKEHFPNVSEALGW